MHLGNIPQITQPKISQNLHAMLLAHYDGRMRRERKSSISLDSASTCGAVDGSAFVLRRQVSWSKVNITTLLWKQD